ncbi:hypothetical protein BS47DRAFT_759461 [Hydnum rufescens UP504]|uniref:Uncharacterized protein n=1 Tax=Hydnum rufescens UP504 TaxID=1448309 RepID=A0A9P6BA68_9AGAM|nr:hypothetical protein BS47DRAFT_759461 [Hydnum rufescens UP504]
MGQVNHASFPLHFTYWRAFAVRTGKLFFGQRSIRCQLHCASSCGSPNLDPNACDRELLITMSLNTASTKDSPLSLTSDSFYTIHKVLLAELSRIFKRCKTSSRGRVRKGCSKTDYMRFVVLRDFHSGARVFERVDEILLQDDTIQDTLMTSLETGASVSTVANLVIGNKGDLARAPGKNIVEWERGAKETAMEAVRISHETLRRSNR